jgi:hypothetical protein
VRQTSLARNISYALNVCHWLNARSARSMRAIKKTNERRKNGLNRPRVIICNERVGAPSAWINKLVEDGCRSLSRRETLMTAPRRAARRGKQPRVNLPASLPKIELHHGEAIWVLEQLGFRGNTSRKTFYEYVKSLRKLGIPFPPGQVGFARKGLANYSYCHLMELALACKLRVYNIVPDAVLRQLVKNRARLYRQFRQAYDQRLSGIGTPIQIKGDGRASISLRGAFLDLRLNFAGGRLMSFGPPALLSPRQALAVYAYSNLTAQALLPMNISFLSEALVNVSLHAPVIRRGPISGSRASVRRSARRGRKS